MAIPKLGIPSPVATTTKRVLDGEAMRQHEKSPLRPRVSFCESKNIVVEPSWYQEDCKALWFSAEELHDIKQDCYSLVKLIHKKENETEGLHHDTYKNVLLRVYDACCAAEMPVDDRPLLSRRDKGLLLKIVSKSGTRTGLERVCIREIAHDRRRRRGEVVDAVLGIQAHRHVAVDAERTCVELTRLSSEALSRASRLFARYTAVALAATLQ